MKTNRLGLPRVSLNLFEKIWTFGRPQAAANQLRYKAIASYFNSSGYITPGSNRKTMRGWDAHSGTADADSIAKLSDLRQGSRDLVMNTPIASAPLNREVINAVGWGLILQSRVDRNFLGLTSEQAADWERNTEREFKLWAESKDCDSARTLNFYEQQSLALYNVGLSGDVFILMPHIKRKDNPYSLSIMTLEADMVSNPNDQFDTNEIAGGIKIDGMGAPVSYFVRKISNSYLDVGYTASDTWVEVPAYGPRTGRRNVLHLFHKKRPGQRRGIPTLAPVLETLKQLSRLTEAELSAAVINSFFTVFIKHNSVTDGLAPIFTGDQSITETQNRPGDDKMYEMGSANILELPDDGSSIELADPKRPNAAFEPFFMALVKQMGSCLDIPFEQMILHFASSYSASRAALLEAWKFYRTRRMWLSRNYCQPVYGEWLAEAVVRGRISAPGFFSDPAIRAAWSGAHWVGPGQGQIDPLKETKAAELKIQARLSNHDIEFSQIHGGDWEPAMERYEREKSFMTALGIDPTEEEIALKTAGSQSPSNTQGSDDE